MGQCTSLAVSSCIDPQRKRSSKNTKKQQHDGLGGVSTQSSQHQQQRPIHHSTIYVRTAAAAAKGGPDVVVGHRSRHSESSDNFMMMNDSMTAAAMNGGGGGGVGDRGSMSLVGSDIGVVSSSHNNAIQHSSMDFTTTKDQSTLNSKIQHHLRHQSVPQPQHQWRRQPAIGSTVLHGRYEVLPGLLGKGHFAKVKKCIDLCSGEVYAIKQIDKKELVKNSAIVTAEIEILKRVGWHRHVVTLIDSFEERSEWHLVMQYCAGGDLFSKIVETGKYTESQAARCCRQLAEALRYIHVRGVVHRDLKPENILLVENDINGDIKVADFGLAKLIKGHANVMRTVCGTWAYCAPEVINRKPYTSAVDNWTLGVLMYILLSGYHPFDVYGELPEPELLQRIIAVKYDFEDAVWTHVSVDAKKLIQQLLIYEPTKRLSLDDYLASSWIQRLGGQARSDAERAAAERKKQKAKAAEAAKSKAALDSRRNAVQKGEVERRKTSPATSGLQVVVAKQRKRADDSQTTQSHRATSPQSAPLVPDTAVSCGEAASPVSGSGEGADTASYMARNGLSSATSQHASTVVERLAKLAVGKNMFRTMVMAKLASNKFMALSRSGTPTGSERNSLQQPLNGKDNENGHGEMNESSVAG